MKGPLSENPQARFKDLWCQWAAIVELFARRKPARRRVRTESYQKLHQELIATCRSLADSSDDAHRAFYTELEGLAMPWMAPRTLAQTDFEILRGLLARCREIETKLGKRGLSPAGLARMIGFTVATIGLTCLLGVLWVAGFNPNPAVGAAREWTDTIWFAVKRSNDMQRFGALAFFVVLVSVYFVSRTARS